MLKLKEWNGGSLKGKAAVGNAWRERQEILGEGRKVCANKKVLFTFNGNKSINDK